MEQMIVTAKIQISVDTDSKVLLDETMSVYSDACNYVSNYVFHTHDLKQFSLNKMLYSALREKFGLKSQMAQSVLKTVIARYKTILENQKKWIRPFFKKPQYDLVWNRDYSLTQNCFSVNTLNGRIKLSYFANGMSKYFDHTIYKFGTAKLVNKSWSFYDLEQKLIYKAKQNQSTVIKVNPRYTSQCCPICGHTEKSNRNKKIHLFTCKNCGYKSNDDRIGAMNLYRKGINYLEDNQVPNTVTVE